MSFIAIKFTIIVETLPVNSNILMTDSFNFLNTSRYSVVYCTHSWLGMAGNSPKYFAVQPTQNHQEVTDLSNDTFFMNTLNEFYL